MNRFISKHFFYFPVVLLRNERFATELRRLTESQFHDLTDIRLIQEAKFTKLLERARNRSLYFREKLTGVQGLADLERIELLEKSIIRNKPDLFLTSTGCMLRKKTSGGSTGAPVTIYKDARAMASEYAAAWRGFGWAGIGIGDKQARFWGVPQSSLKQRFRANLIDLICNRHRVSAFDYGESTWAKAYESLNKFKPDYLYGYVSMLREFAKYIDNNVAENAVKPISIIATSEVLTSFDRETLSATFDCRVYDEYGCGEVGTIAHECEFGKRHVHAENVILEVVDCNGKQLPPGRPGEIVVTDLDNAAMPLIRYRLKDWGVLSTESCACGRGLPILERVFGRAYDSLLNGEGRCFHGEFFLYIIEDASEKGMPVEGVQFVQDRTGTITVNLICSDGVFEPIKAFIKKRLVGSFDEHAVVEFQKVRAINREPSGKIRVVKRVE